jgi:hypothetical protein
MKKIRQLVSDLFTHGSWSAREATQPISLVLKDSLDDVKGSVALIHDGGRFGTNSTGYWRLVFSSSTGDVCNIFRVIDQFANGQSLFAIEQPINCVVDAICCPTAIFQHEEAHFTGLSFLDGILKINGEIGDPYWKKLVNHMCLVFLPEYFNEISSSLLSIDLNPVKFTEPSAPSPSAA